ncbi:MAG: HAD-IA family hydrolase [Actinomycetales bacterium]|nr:HAD-IA family hydrolase [Actinomycetales bacterium]
MIRLIAFDVAGTTVSDGGLVLRAFERAFSEVVPNRWAAESEQFRQYAIATMGQSKIEVFSSMLGDADVAAEANVAFESAYLSLVRAEGISEIQGASDVFVELKSRGLKIALTTGFSRATLDAILESLEWTEIIDASAVPSEAGAGRPNPAMLDFVSRKLSINPDEVIVLGDTQSDMQAAVRFGAAEVIGVLTGTHSTSELIEAGANTVLESVRKLPNHLFNQR